MNHKYIVALTDHAAHDLPDSEAICNWKRGSGPGAERGSQPALKEDGSLYFQELIRELPCLVTRDKDHRRIEKQEYRLLPDLSWLPARKTALALWKHTDFGRRASIQKKRFAAARNPDRFLDILFAKL